jgi:hypothetical protein
MRASRTPDRSAIIPHMEPSPLVDVRVLARLMRLPRQWLMDEALAGRIPSLRVEGEPRFNPDAVRQCVLRRAAVEGLRPQEVAHAS